MIVWTDHRAGSDAAVAIGAYQIVHPRPGDKRFIVRFQRVPISRQAHIELKAAKAEAEAHHAKVTRA